MNVFVRINLFLLSIYMFHGVNASSHVEQPRSGTPTPFNSPALRSQSEPDLLRHKAAVWFRFQRDLKSANAWHKSNIIIAPFCLKSIAKEVTKETPLFAGQENVDLHTDIMKTEYGILIPKEEHARPFEQH